MGTTVNSSVNKNGFKHDKKNAVPYGVSNMTVEA